MDNVSEQDVILMANTIRGLSMDGVEKAGSGHPGMPMGMAEVASTLFLKHFKHCPTKPHWFDRDRFVLSAGHGSMLLYGLLHLSGYDLPLTELQEFRQWKSATPGHPEYGTTPGVETTTGPLGQGCGNATGMALAERMLASRFNTEDFKPVDHYSYVIASDGDLMEGVSHEAFALAGHLGLHNLIVFYDCNCITIDGSTDLSYSDDVRKRFEGYNWHVLEVDAHKYAEIDEAITKAKQETEKPTIVICHSHIGQGSPNKVDSAAAHGAPLGEEEIREAKKSIGIPEDALFHVPDEVKKLLAERLAELEGVAEEWEKSFEKYCEEHPDKAALWKTFMEDVVPDNIEVGFEGFPADNPVATRNASGTVMQHIAEKLPQFVGGAGDLAASTKTTLKKFEDIARGSYNGRNINFGVREHGMAAILNGMALHGGFRVFGSTFFVFLDYCRPSVRLAAIMKLPVVYVFTHDSFNVGEDGPTHQPVEQLASLRCMPDITVIRPSDATETAAAWFTAIAKKTGPTVLALTRHKLKVIDRDKYADASNLSKGAYVLWQSGEGTPDFIIIGSGSEVEASLEAAEILGRDYNVRIVSMPSWDLFDAQDNDYRTSVLPPECKLRLAVEAGVSMGWERYIGSAGRTICLDSFGTSAPYPQLQKEFGFTAGNIVATAKNMLENA